MNYTFRKPSWGSSSLPSRFSDCGFALWKDIQGLGGNQPNMRLNPSVQVGCSTVLPHSLHHLICI